MRIVAGLSVHQLGGDDHFAVRLRRRTQQLFHPGVVVGAVDDRDLRARDLARDSGRGLEQMRVLVRAVHDAGDRDPVAADLARDVAVEIFRRHHGDLAFGFAVGGAHGRGEGQRGKGEEGGEPGDCLHDGKTCVWRNGDPYM